jgi:protein phosphatase 1L
MKEVSVTFIFLFYVGDQGILQPLFWSSPQEAIKNAYCSTNKYILENTKQLGPGGSSTVLLL